MLFRNKIILRRRKHLSIITSNQIKILNVSDGTMNIQHLGDLPQAPSTEGLSPGAMYYDTTKKASYIFDGTDWKLIAADGLAGDAGILDMRYGDGETFTYGIDADGNKINIGIQEGTWVGYKIVSREQTDSDFIDEDTGEIIQSIYDSYGWNKNDVAFGIKYFVQFEDSRITKIYQKEEVLNDNTQAIASANNNFIYNPSNLSFSCLSETNNKNDYLGSEYYYKIIFSFIVDSATQSYTYVRNGEEYHECNKLIVSVPFTDIIEQFGISDDIVSCQIELYRLDNVTNAYVALASSVIYTDYAMNSDMAKLALNAYDITASIGSNKLIFNENGLSIYEDGLKIYKNTENTVEPVFYANDTGDLVLKGNIEALGGTLGGWIIDEEDIYDLSRATGLHSGSSLLLKDTNDPIRFYAGGRINNPTFSVTASGILTAQQAIITGEINASSGTIKNYMIVGKSANGITIYGGDSNNSFISTNSYASGALGTGWKISSNGEAEFTNISARGKIASSVFEHNKISAIGGSLYITPTVHMSMQSSEIALDIISDENNNSIEYYLVSWDYGEKFTDNVSGAGGRAWKIGDEIRLEGIVAKTNQDTGLQQIDITNVIATIDGINNNIVTVRVPSSQPQLATSLQGGHFIEGTLLIFYGTILEGQSELQKSGIYLTAVDTEGPFIDVYDIKGETETTPAVRMGRLSGIKDMNFGVSSLSGYGLYSTNAYLTGQLTLPNAGVSNQGVIGYRKEKEDAYFILQEADDSGSEVRFWAGGEYPAVGKNVAPFIVTQDGSLYATKGIFEGTVRAKDGYFSGIIKSAGIVLNTESNSNYDHSQFFVAYSDNPAGPDDYVLNIDNNGLSIWEGALRVYSDEAKNDSYTYNNSLSDYQSPLPYLFLQDVYSQERGFEGRVVAHSLHNFQLGANNGDLNYSIVLNQGIWFYNSTNTNAIHALAEESKRDVENRNYNNANTKKTGIALKDNSLTLTSDTYILLDSDTTFKSPQGEIELKIGDLSIIEVQAENKTIGLNIF